MQAQSLDLPLWPLRLRALEGSTLLVAGNIQLKHIPDGQFKTSFRQTFSPVSIIACEYNFLYRYFPLEMLVRHLEVISCRFVLITLSQFAMIPKLTVACILREGGDPAWVPVTLQGVGVSVARLLDVYNRLYTAKDSVWLTSGDELHILKVILLLKIFSRLMFSGFVCPSLRFCFSPKQSPTL